MKKRFIVLLAFLGAVAGSLVTILVANLYFKAPPGYSSIEQHQNSWLSGLQNFTGAKLPTGLNFVYAANSVRGAVVHVQTSYGPRRRGSQDRLGNLFGPGEDYSFHDGPREASGSGVIISDDGFIVTNNHVINDASEIRVVLNDRRTYKAKVIGTDPTTDLALLRIEADNLPFVAYGNSDSLQIGEWVLAVGNPFELTSTVTAGIVSAKARNINILAGRENMAVESFIQTDAAVNPGNSGGALVDLRGRLIGINTAIASSTGTYAGYSFAVPVTLVKKVMDDLLKYGEVQRALLGVSIRDVDAELAEAEGMKDTRGVYIAGVGQGSAAAKAGLRTGDVILNVDGIETNSVAALQEYVARFRPGDKLKVNYERGRNLEAVTVTLRSTEGTETIAKAVPRPALEVANLGATLQRAGNQTLGTLGITHGVEVTKVEEDGRLGEAGMQAGFIITYIDKKAAQTPREVAKVITSTKGGVLIEGLYPDGRRAYYAVGF